MSSENWTTALTLVLPWEFRHSKQPERSYDVPAQIHFIWYGSHAPEEVLDNTTRCQELNLAWRVTLWSDRPQPHIRVPVKLFTDYRWRNQDIIDAFSDHLGVLGDLLRYEIVYAHGGIYLDTDVKCLLPFAAPMFQRAFVTAEMMYYRGVTNAAFGFARGSSFLAYVLACVRENVFERWPQTTVTVGGPPFLTTCVRQYADSKIQNIPQQILLGHLRSANDVRPLYAQHRLAAEWQKTKQENMHPFYQRLFNEPAPSVSIPEPA